MMAIPALCLAAFTALGASADGIGAASDFAARLEAGRADILEQANRSEGFSPQVEAGIQDTAARLLVAGRSLGIAAGLLRRYSPLPQARSLEAKAVLVSESAEALLRTAGGTP